MLERVSPLGRWPPWAVAGAIALATLAVVTSFAAWRGLPALGLSAELNHSVAPFVAVAFVFYASIIGYWTRRRA